MHAPKRPLINTPASLLPRLTERKSRAWLAASIGTLLVGVFADDVRAAAVVYTGGTITETFNSLGPDGLETTLLTGPTSFTNDGTSPWFAGVVASGAGNTAAVVTTTTLNTVSDGSVAVNNPAARLLNNGDTGATDRALGTGNTGGDPVLDLAFQNATGNALGTINVAYTTEWWQSGNAANVASLGYLLYFSPTGAAGTWLDTGAPQPTKTFATANEDLDGNDPLNQAQTTISFMLPVPVAASGTFFLRWRDSNDPSVSPDANIAIDSVTFSGGPPVQPGKTVVYNLAHSVGGAPNGNFDLSGSNYWLSNGAPAAFANNDVAEFSQNGTATINVPVDVAPNATNVTAASGTYTIGGAGRIGGTLTKSNAGTLVLTSANSFALSTLSGGTIITQNAASLGAGNLTLNGTGGTLQADVDLTIGGVNGTGPLIKTGSGALIFSGAGNGTGGINIQAGKLSLMNASGLGGANQTVTLNGNLLEFTNAGEQTFSDAATARTINVGATAASIAVTNAGGGVIIGSTDAITGSGTITKTGPGALRVAGDNLGLTSNWVIAEGTLEARAGTPLGTGTVTANPTTRFASQNTAVSNSVTLAGGELATRSGDGADFTGAINVTAPSTAYLRSYTTVANPHNITISGVLSGTGNLDVLGQQTAAAGTKALILTNAANTYTGTLTVSAGAGLAGVGNTRGAVNVSALGTLDPGVGATIPANGPGVFSIGGNLTLEAGAVFHADISGADPAPTAGTDYDQIAVGTGTGATSTGTVTLGGSDLVLTLGAGVVEVNDIFFLILNDGIDPVVGTFNNLPDGATVTTGSQQFFISYDANSTTGTFLGGNDVALMLIPEPASAGLLVVGGALLLQRRRRA